MPEHLTAFIWYFLRRHLIYVLGFLSIIIIASLEISLSPYLLKIIIDTATQYTDNKALFLQAVIYPAAFYVLLTIIHNVAMRAYHYLCMSLFPKLRVEVSVALFDYLTQHSVTFFQQNFSGDLANKIQNIVDGVESIIKKVNQYILGNAFTLLISLMLLASVHIYFAVILLIFISIYVMSGYLLSKKTAIHAHSFSLANSQLTGQLVDSIANISSAKIFANVGFETNRVDNMVNSVSQKEKRLQKQIMRADFIQNINYTFLIIMLLAGLIYGRVNTWITVGDFAFILGLSITVYTMVNGLTKGMPDLSMDIGKCQQALNVIIVPHDINDLDNAAILNVDEGKIRFHDVSFHYEGNEKLFDHFNLSIKAKQKVALVGYSGAGKTSLINLLLRLYDIQEGKITIDNQNINAVTRESLIKNIALIPQHPELFHRSIMDNIRYGNTEASDEAVYHAAKLAKCHAFIMQLPEGYYSMVGEKGIKLSGGQRQRIAIARAVLKNAPILILDEATSALDSATEKDIQEALASLMTDKTVIVVAHRLSTIMAMDRILFFKDGQVIEDGSVTELQKIDGHFAHLLKIQKME